MKVEIEREIEQVTNGSAYKGHLLIGQTKFAYELNFAVPVSQLDDMAPITDKEEIRRVFNISIKKDEVEVELGEKEYGVFFSMIALFAVEFYNNPQTQDSNQGLIGAMMQKKGIFGAIGASASIGMTSKGSLDLPAEVCEILNAPKFGCALTA